MEEMRLVLNQRDEQETAMRRIALITDREILGTDGLSSAPPHVKARAILRNPRGELALTHEAAFGIYVLPGGALEDGESVEEALRRELREETGCRVLRCQELGCVEENRAHSDSAHLSCYYVVDTDTETFSPSLTAEEERAGVTVAWVPFEEARRLITEERCGTAQQKFLRARDLAALAAYEEWLRNGQKPG